MSTATAGKVLLIPKGEYDATTQYKVLDWVLYQGRPYVAKQTTTGNAPIYEPTQANPDAYWQLLLDFPTVVDNVPTQNSNNLVKSGGVYSVTADKMKKDGSNAENVIFGSEDGSYSYLKFDITKAAGDGENVVLTATITQSGNDNVRAEDYLTTQIGGQATFVDGSTRRRIVIDAVTSTAGTGSDSVTVTAHLVNDISAAISLTNVDVDLVNYAGGDYSFIHGKGNNEDGFYNTVIGINGSADGEGNFIAGRNNVIDGNFSASIGQNNYGVGATDVLGRGLVAGTTGQVVVGKYNNNKSTSIFEIGGGNAITRKNALEIKDDGSFSLNDGVDFYKFAKLNGVDGFYDGSGVFHTFTGYKELIQTNITLSTSQTTDVTFTDASISSSSTIEPFTSDYSIAPSGVDATTTPGTCVVTLPKVSSAVTIDVKIRVS